MAQQDFVPLSEEPKHVPKLVNEIVRAVHVTLPPGGSTLFHEHTADVATVTLEGADLANQEWGDEPTVAQNATGRASYSSYAGTSRIHRITNVGESTFRIIGVEIFSPPALEAKLVPERDAPFELALDNDRVRIWRLALEPGASSSLSSVELPTVRITQKGGTLAESINGASSEAKETQLGDLQWLSAGSAVSIRNAGGELVVIYDMEIK
jgi:hypothetical protein